ncbi:MAG: PorV/PorQ family protein [Bacteroidetes bacterium]|nr:PorV/PorQ family protein [Bacteroidota bacterium]
MSKILLMILTLALCASQGYAGNKSRTGTAGAVELLIPVSAKNLAVGNSMISAQSGIDGVSVNPASIGLLSKNELAFSTFDYLAGIKLYYFAGGFSFGDLGNLGFSIRSLDFGKIDKTTNESPEGTGETFSPTYVTASVILGRELTENIQFGMQVKYVHESFNNASAGGVGFDVGFQYTGVSVLPGLNFGIALKNINLNKLKFEGQGMTNATGPVAGANLGVDKKQWTTPTESFDMPSTFEFGLSYELGLDDLQSLTLGTTYINNNISTDEYNFGGEYNYQNMIFLRSGYSYVPDGIDNLYGLTLGGGLSYNLGFQLTVDYAYQQVNYFSGANQLVTLRIGI